MWAWGLGGGVAGEAELLLERTVAEVSSWGVCEVGAWLEGVGREMGGPKAALAKAGVSGPRLLLLSQGELVGLGVPQLGLRHLLLSALGQLNSLLHETEWETAAWQAAQVAVAAKALIGTASAPAASLADSLAAVSATVHQTKALLAWLDRRPFLNSPHYALVRRTLMDLALALVSEAQRTQPSSLRLSELAFALANEAQALVDRDDPLLLTPAHLEKMRLRRVNDSADWPGINLSSTSRGIHVVESINADSAQAALKIQPGDEIVKVGPQLVVGWQLSAVQALLKAAPKELDLVVKKRPSTGKSAPSTPRLGNRLGPPVVTQSPMVMEEAARKPSGRFRSQDRQRLRSTSTGEVSSEEALAEEEGGDSLAHRPSLVRRASISGGSPTLQRVSRHLDRTSSLLPTNPTGWVQPLGPTPSLPIPPPKRFSTSEEDSEEDEAGEVFLNQVPTPPAQLISDESEVMAIDDVVEVVRGDELSRLEELLLTDRPEAEEEWDPSASFRSTASKADKTRYKLARFFGAAPPSGEEEIGMAGVGLLEPPSGRLGSLGAEEEAERVWDKGAEELEPSEMRGWLWRSRLPGEPQTVSKWRKRWMVLKGPLLFVFKTEKSLEAEGVISLRTFEAKMAAEGYRGSKKFLLALSSTSSKVSYLFYCDEAQSRALWLKHIGAARIELVQKPVAQRAPIASLPFGGAFWRPTAAISSSASHGRLPTLKTAH